MTPDPEQIAAQIAARPLFRRLCFYSDTGPNTVAILNGLALATKDDWSPAERAVIADMMNQALVLGGSREGPAIPISAFYHPGDGRLCVVLPTTPQVIIVEGGPPIQRPSAIVGPQGTALPRPN